MLVIVWDFSRLLFIRVAVLCCLNYERAELLKNLALSVLLGENYNKKREVWISSYVSTAIII